MESELEHVVLGVVGLKQPCSAYAIRMVFAESPSRHWSGSAGAIYPLVRRLEGRGLLKSTIRGGDRREARLYRLTPKGRNRLGSWLRPPLPDAAGLMVLDPLRVRVRFLEAVAVQERRAIVDEAETKLGEQLEQINLEAENAKRGGDLFLYLSHRGAVRSLRAQMDWLREVRQTLSRGGFHPVS
jgi:DNA-binding PadR family transcriptional regulator